MARTRRVHASGGRILRSAKKATTGSSWALLPLEIRQMVIEEIACQKHRGWGSCAAVCKEWQMVIEKENFRRLNLRASCLEEVEHMVVRQRHLVRHLSLDIELPRYSCRSCWNAETEARIRQNAAIFQATVLRLFSVLSPWQPAGSLVLELGAYSPSDSEHWFKHWHVGRHASSGHWHDPTHGWVNGRQVEAPSAPAVMRSFCPIGFSLPESIPEVRAVTGLLIRRQYLHSAGLGDARLPASPRQNHFYIRGF